MALTTPGKVYLAFILGMLVVGLLVIAGCTDTLPTETDLTAGEAALDAEFFGKTAADKDAICSANPTDPRIQSKCARWCANPSSNCDGDPPPPPSDDPVANFSYSANELTVQFTNTSQNDDASSWDFGDGTGSSADSPSHTYASEGTYSVSLTVTNEDGSDTETKSVTVSEDTPPPPPNPDSEMLDVAGRWQYEQVFMNVGDEVCTIGYSNTAQWFQSWLATFASRYAVNFTNAATGGRALERWATEFNSLIGNCPSNTKFIIAQISSQANTATQQDVINTIDEHLPLLHDQLVDRFPGVQVLYIQGEAAHYVNTTKRWGIREPARWYHGDPIVRNVASFDQATLASYFWTSIGEANLVAECGTWLPSDNIEEGSPGNDFDQNQHPSEAGRQKMNCWFAAWMDAYVTISGSGKAEFVQVIRSPEGFDSHVPEPVHNGIFN